MENVSCETPLYVITEGSEPQYYTRFFTWDFAKSAVSLYLLDYSAFGVVQTSRDKLIFLPYELRCMVTHLKGSYLLSKME
jgi:hypothetical protein